MLSSSVLLLRLYTTRFIVHAFGTEDCKQIHAINRRQRALVLINQSIDQCRHNSGSSGTSPHTYMPPRCLESTHHSRLTLSPP
jgi:hypothetical protein